MDISESKCFFSLLLRRGIPLWSQNIDEKHLDFDGSKLESLKVYGPQVIKERP